LSPEKTKIVHIDDGLDFLGWNLRKYGGKLLIKPAKKNVQAHSRKVRETIKGMRTAKQEEVIAKLNPIIRGWANYHQNQVAKKTFNKVDHLIWRRLWRWAYRRHPNKSKTWVKKRYFHTEGMRNWVFGTKVKGDGGEKKLVCASDTPIQRHIKIKGAANIFDPAWEPYFEQRLGLIMKNSLKGRERLLRLWQAQKGRCPNCNELITKESGWHVHHVLPKAQGGTDNQANLMLLHPNCHRQIHNSDKSERPTPVKTEFRGGLSRVWGNS
jgi:RNA-directed DNA polymerase